MWVIIMVFKRMRWSWHCEHWLILDRSCRLPIIPGALSKIAGSISKPILHQKGSFVACRSRNPCLTKAGIASDKHYTSMHQAVTTNTKPRPCRAKLHFRTSSWRLARCCLKSGAFENHQYGLLVPTRHTQPTFKRIPNLDSNLQEGHNVAKAPLLYPSLPYLTS